MPQYLVDVERLTRELAQCDARVPAVLFGLLGLFFDRGPFSFDAEALSGRLNETNLKSRLNPLELASLQPELERFFEETGEGWAPRGALFQRRVH